MDARSFPAAVRRAAGSSSLIERVRFGERSRLSGRKTYDEVFAKGRKVAGADLLLWVRRRGEGPDRGQPRLGLSVSRKLGGAVRRTRVKRLLREAFRLHQHRLPPDCDVVAYPRPGCPWKRRQDAEQSLLALCRRAGILRPGA